MSSPASSTCAMGGRDFTVGPGDSFRFRGEEYSWANPYDDPAWRSG